MGYEDREAVARRELDRIAHDYYPDNPDVQWQLVGFEHRDDRSYAEAVPEPLEVGYDRFKFVLQFADPPHAAPVEATGCYVWEDGSWSLLSGTDPHELHESPAAPAGQSGCLGVLLVGLGLATGFGFGLL